MSQIYHAAFSKHKNLDIPIKCRFTDLDCRGLLFATKIGSLPTKEDLFWRTALKPGTLSPDFPARSTEACQITFLAASSADGRALNSPKRCRHFNFNYLEPLLGIALSHATGRV